MEQSLFVCLADLFSKIHKYKINISQELLAYGITNVFSGFFPCFATGASLARSCVQNNAGGRTQVTLIKFALGICFLFTFLFCLKAGFNLFLDYNWYRLAFYCTAF